MVLNDLLGVSVDAGIIRSIFVRSTVFPHLGPDMTS